MTYDVLSNCYPDRLKGRLHTRCALLRCANNTLEAYYQRSATTRRSVCVNGPLEETVDISQTVNVQYNFVSFV